MGWRKKKDNRQQLEMAGFIAKYKQFQALLASNAELLALIADFEEKLAGRGHLDRTAMHTQARQALQAARQMVESFSTLAGQRLTALDAALERLGSAISRLTDADQTAKPPDLVIPHARVDTRMLDWVGGKNAHLGEMRNQVGVPVPDGFAITAVAFQRFMARNALSATIMAELAGLDADNPQLVEALSEKIQRLVLSAPMPEELEHSILAAFDAMASSFSDAGGVPIRIAMRSSATGEDGEHSFAGQYRSVLNVTRDRVLQTYRLVIASLYTPRAISYRQHQGVGEDGLAMSVACLLMVDAVASGIVYTRHPNHPGEQVHISAVWGLGPYAVEGRISPDLYVVAKDDELTIVSKQVADKVVQLVGTPDGRLSEIALPDSQRLQSCLTDTQIKTLTGFALRLERHYQCPQDIEWALMPGGQIVLLQTRPLQTMDCAYNRKAPPVAGAELLLAGEMESMAVAGVAHGPAFLVRGEKDLADFPTGGVLVARHSSPKFVVVMKSAAAIVTDAGSITGHMASLCREYGVPTLLNLKNATQVIRHGEMITVDAGTTRIYRGVVPELKDHRSNTKPAVLSPLRSQLQRLADLITPLNLLDPNHPDFQPEACASLHDIARYVHEHSYQVMFRISDEAHDSRPSAIKLMASVPLDLYLIDLGGGLKASLPKAPRKASLAEVASAPLLALLDGLLDESLARRQPRAVDLGGFFSVMQAQMLSNQEALGDRSYAIISDKYLNFSSRLGYHYSILDAYCGRTINKNYITFRFKGGAADELRRTRRAQVISKILENLDFSVAMKVDQVDARFQKYDRADIAQRLSMLGRLLQFTRQLDMLMASDTAVDLFVQAFLDGNYHYDGS
ncbi:MAG: phosphoenolpyruvate synthase [Desulfobacterales bacterium]|nr:phosphoenolpyruvate synthase [Desulfobacterales bacterium]